MANKDAAAFVAESGGEVVGWANVSQRQNFITKEKYADFHSIYVAPSQRGGGVVAALVEAVFDHCRQRNMGKVVFRTRADNERMKSVLARVGFVPTQIYYEKAFGKRRRGILEAVIRSTATAELSLPGLTGQPSTPRHLGRFKRLWICGRPVSPGDDSDDVALPRRHHEDVVAHRLAGDRVRRFSQVPPAVPPAAAISAPRVCNRRPAPPASVRARRDRCRPDPATAASPASLQRCWCAAGASDRRSRYRRAGRAAGRARRLISMSSAPPRRRVRGSRRRPAPARRATGRELRGIAPAT